MDKSKIFNIITDNISSFTQCYTLEQKKKWLDSYNIEIPIVNLHSMQTIYDYLTNSNGKYCKCGNECKFIRFTHKTPYRKFCSKACLHKYRSEKMIGSLNNIHKVSKARLLEIGRENGIRLKRMVADGTFTPCVTNSWAKSRCIVNIIRNGVKCQVKCRSSWDAYFQIKNPNLIYEKIRIPYINKDKISTYIIDFVDEELNILYEIKPDSFRNTKLNEIKFSAADKFARENGYKFKIIGNKWFHENYNESILSNQPDELKIKRLLKQFKINEN